MENLTDAGTLPATSDIELTKKGEEYCRLAEACGVSFITITTDDRRSIGAAIDRLVAMLDAMEPDPDLEDTGDDEPTMGWAEHNQWDSLQHPDADECEDVSEDEGACIQSQRHDAADEGNDEPNLGRLETLHQGAGSYCGGSDDVYCEARGPLRFDGEGGDAARKVLRNLQTARPDVPQDYVRGSFFGDPNVLKVEGLSISSNKGRQRREPEELTILRPGVAIVGGFRDPDDDRIPEIDMRAQWHASQRY